MSRAVSHQTEIPLGLERRNFLPTREYIPEPCCFPALRWCFSLLAAAVLIFVILVFLFMLYDVLSREESEGASSTLAWAGTIPTYI